MKKVLILIAIGLLVCSACLIAAEQSSVQASPEESSPTIFVDPSEIEAAPLSFFRIRIAVANVSDLYAGEFNLFYAHSKSEGTITIISGYGDGVRKGPVLVGMGAFFVSTINDYYNSTHGMIHVGWTLVGKPKGVNVEGSWKMILATVDCAAMAPGQSVIALSDTVLLNSTNAKIPHQILNAHVLIGILHDPDNAVISVTPLKYYAIDGLNVTVLVEVANLVFENPLSQNQTFNVSLYYGPTPIGTITVKDLRPFESRTLEFNWSTKDIPPDNYTITAAAEPVPGEVNLDNNNATTTVLIPIPGDVWGPNGFPDGVVDILDLSRIAASYPSAYPDSRYDPYLDLNSDGKIDIVDVAAIALLM